ncbi:DUF2799 domain-containing protein [Vibrio gangliei]|uniref:DUF2799 domain-containing protein n=1 Tax=Vibrio gangliei TaxID=2077090 RepID=UPI000D01849F|nr:DUF2799 domain-containing protein [Vibrio gangliei]
MRNYSNIVIFSFFILGCAHSVPTTEEYWYKQGFMLGVRGQFIDHAKLLIFKEDKQFDNQSYHRGYVDGKSDFCDPEQAFNKGISGIKYSDQCDEFSQHVRIKAEWQRGWEAFISMGLF